MGSGGKRKNGTHLSITKLPEHSGAEERISSQSSRAEILLFD